MKKLFSILSIMLIVLQLSAQDFPKRPNKDHLVNDFADVLSPQEEQSLERKLVNYFAQTSTQISIVTVEDLQGYDISDYAFGLGEAWGIGNAKFDNGILLLMKPKTNSSNGQVTVAVGYGLEGAVPDITARQVVDYELIPYFKQGDIYGGFNQATNVLISLTQGEFNAQQYADHHQSSGGGFPFAFFILIPIIFSFLFGGNRRRSFSSYGGRSSSLPFWLAMGMMNSNRNHHGSFNDFSSGGGSFGGGSSFDSFGGFGGGSFGGGGASGSW